MINRLWHPAIAKCLNKDERCVHSNIKAQLNINLMLKNVVNSVLCIDSAHNKVKEGRGGGGRYQTFPILRNFRTLSFEINQNSVRYSVSISYFTNKEF